jgi:hypothetical protein
MIDNISLDLLLDPNTPKLAQVNFVATIDAVTYGTGPDSFIGPNGWWVGTPLQGSPAADWEDAVGVNYWEPQGYRLSGEYLGIISGASMSGVTNYEMINDNHSQIAVDPWVISNLETFCDTVFSSLSPY